MSIANFRGEIIDSRLISAGGSGNGIANFDSNIIEGNVGTAAARLDEANFANNAYTNQINTAEIHANEINVDGRIALQQDVIFDGATSFAATSRTNSDIHKLTIINDYVTFHDNATILTTSNDTGAYG